MLWRLERAGIDVGGRWIELADKSAARVGDVQNIFTVPHFMMALAAVGREAEAERYLAAIRGAAEAGVISAAATLREVVIPASAAVLAHRKGEHARVVSLLEPIRRGIHRIGGSHAQRDLFAQMLLDSAMRSGRTELARAILADEAHARPAPLAGRRGYADAAKRFLH
jgi:hypothetical protein